MTAKTGKNEVDDVDEVEAVPAEAEAEETEAEETEVEARPARPAAKRKRRVRVIEVIDDEDLDEVLEALDAEDAKAGEAEPAGEDDEAEEEPPARPAKTAKAAAKPAPKPAAKAKPRPTRLEPPEEEAEEEAPKKVPVSKSAARSEDVVVSRPVLGLSPVHLTVLVLLIALVPASVAGWQWWSGRDREAVSEVASDYGDVALNYNAQNYQTQMDKAQELMGGDLLESFKNTTLPQLGETFKSNPEVALSSKTNQVFVGSVDGKFATAVVMVDVNVKTKDGSSAAPATLLRLALAKIDGEWKVTKQYASGVNDQNQNQGQGQLPTAPTGGASESPAPEESDKPGN